MTIQEKIIQVSKSARAASRKLANISTGLKNDAIIKMADIIEKRTDFLVQENKKDLYSAQEKGLSSAMIDRLTLNIDRIKDMADGLREVAALPDPVGEVIKMWRRPNNLEIGKIRIPIGVIGIIYESRPNVTADAASLCLKSGNVVILKGGSEAIHSNIAIVNLLCEAAISAGIPEGSIQLIDVTGREAVSVMLKQDKFIDLIIPRGGEGLIRAVAENSSIPVIKHDKGLCHIYIDADADIEMGKKIVVNAKTQRPSVCNALETLLVHKDIASRFLPDVSASLKEKNVEIRGCAKTGKIISDIKDAVEDDWSTEYLDYIISIKIVEGIDEAIDHINTYGSMLADAIITKDYDNARKFLYGIDSAAVYVNASTRFTDGKQFGLGAEMGISTQKLHARGPMGLEELTCTKYIIFGSGQIRE